MSAVTRFPGGWQGWGRDLAQRGASRPGIPAARRLYEVGPRAWGALAPELATFASEQRARLAALAHTAPLAALREAGGEGTRVASPQPLGGLWRLRSAFGGAGSHPVPTRVVDLGRDDDDDFGSW